MTSKQLISNTQKLLQSIDGIIPEQIDGETLLYKLIDKPAGTELRFLIIEEFLPYGTVEHRIPHVNINCSINISLENATFEEGTVNVSNITYTDFLAETFDANILNKVLTIFKIINDNIINFRRL